MIPKTSIISILATGLLLSINTSFVEDRSENTLIYIGDPMCSWCYGFAPEILEVKEKLPSNVGFELVVGGLRPYGTETMGELKGFLTHHWEDVSKRSGQPFNYDILDQSEWLYDTEPACRAVMTMERLLPQKEMEYFKAIQKGFYYHNYDPIKTETYAAQAETFGVKKDEFARLFESDEMKRATASDFQRARQMGANSFPSVVLKKGDEYILLAKGYGKSSAILKKMDKLLKGGL